MKPHEYEEKLRRERQASCNHVWEVGAHNCIVVGVSKCVECGKISEPKFFHGGNFPSGKRDRWEKEA